MAIKIQNGEELSHRDLHDLLEMEQGTKFVATGRVHEENGKKMIAGQIIRRGFRPVNIKVTN
jgi:hypothetical protein